MRFVGGAFLVAIALVLLYLITTGKLASAIATFHVIAGTAPTSSSSTPGAPTVTPTPTPSGNITSGSNPYGANSWSTPMTFPSLPTLPTTSVVAA